MYDFYYQKLLDDERKFAPREGNGVLEISYGEERDGEKGDTSNITFAQREILEDDIPAWLENDESPAGDKCGMRIGMRLLIGSPEEHFNDAEILPLPISRHTFEALRAAWHLPTELLRMMLSTMPIATEFSTGRDCGLMIRSARSRDWSSCLALISDSQTGIVNGIVLGLQEKEIEMLTTCIRSSMPSLSDPLLLPLFLLELKVHFFALLLEDRAQGIEDIETSTGMTHGFSKREHLSRRHGASQEEQLDKLMRTDFDPITQKLTGVAGTLAFCDMTFESSVRGLETAMAWREKTVQTMPKQGLTVEHEGPWKRCGAIDRRISYLQSLISGAKAHNKVLQARTAAQVQRVYSMIGQRDNRINISTAHASHEIASASLRDNAAMKVIADDSRKVALLTRRDSTDMRIIAWVTLVFLPGTFTATLFSSTFFDFLPEKEQGSIVSWWVWLYCLVTVALTAIVLGAWYWWSRMQRKKTSEVVDLESEIRVEKKRHGGTEVDLGNGVAQAGRIGGVLAGTLWMERSLEGERESPGFCRSPS